jgi:hypothetical protein
MSHPCQIILDALGGEANLESRGIHGIHSFRKEPTTGLRMGLGFLFNDEVENPNGITIEDVFGKYLVRLLIAEPGHFPVAKVVEEHEIEDLKDVVVQVENWLNGIS